MAKEQEAKDMLEGFDVVRFTASLEGDPKAIDIEIGGETITIRRATAANMLDVIDIIKALMMSLGMKSISELSSLEGMMDSPVTVLGMLQDMFPRVRAISVKLSSLGAKEWDELDFDEMLFLVWAQWQVNEHFFMARLPAVLRLVETVNPKPDAEQPKPDAATPAGDAASGN